MKYATAHYSEVNGEKKIFVFVDEPPSDLPEGASLIVETTDQEELCRTLEPYWLMINN